MGQKLLVYKECNNKKSAQKRKRRKRKKSGWLLVFPVILAVVALVSILTKGNVLTDKQLEKSGVPESLIELYDRNEEARQFVLDYNSNKDKHRTIDVSGEVKSGRIPLFLQWDERWGYEKYGDDYLALTGCGPTALSMVYTGLTGDAKMNPLRMANLAEKRGFYVNGSGSSWNMMTEMAKSLGLTAKELSLDKNVICSELKAGHPIICIMRAGDFTSTGHFIVLTSVTENGDIRVNDSNSIKNSKRTWNLDKLMPQIRDLWAYKV